MDAVVRDAIDLDEADSHVAGLDAIEVLHAVVHVAKLEDDFDLDAATMNNEKAKIKINRIE